MSVALNKAIYKRLTSSEGLETYSEALNAQRTLWSLIGRDYDEAGRDLGPAVVYGNKDDSVQFPQVTFRLSGGVESLDGHDFGIIADAVYDIEIWETTRQGGVIEAICEAVERLLDESLRYTPTLSVEGSIRRCYWGDGFTELSIFPDPEINAWVGLKRFRFVESRV